eukprot:c42740_g1_i1 orf=74-226(+)
MNVDAMNFSSLYSWVHFVFALRIPPPKPRDKAGNNSKAQVQNRYHMLGLK